MLLIECAPFCLTVVIGVKPFVTRSEEATVVSRPAVPSNVNDGGNWPVEGMQASHPLRKNRNRDILRKEQPGSVLPSTAVPPNLYRHQVLLSAEGMHSA